MHSQTARQALFRSGRIPPPPSLTPCPRPGAPADAGRPCDFEEFKAAIVARGGARARESLSDWLARADRNPAYLPVRKWVTGHAHGALFGLGLDEVWAVTRHPDDAIRTGHALGDLRWRAEYKAADNFNTPWALQYLLHGLMEKLGRLPRWEDFRAFLKGDEARHCHFGPFERRFLADADPATARLLLEGYRWRVGNAYYSFLREVDLMTRLRLEHGLDVRYHVLADAQFKVDFWVGNVLVAVFIKNPRFREGAAGRKDRVEDLMDVSAFRTLALELEAPTTKGRAALVPPHEVARAAAAIRAASTLN